MTVAIAPLDFAKQKLSKTTTIKTCTWYEKYTVNQRSVYVLRTSSYEKFLWWSEGKIDRILHGAMNSPLYENFSQGFHTTRISKPWNAAWEMQWTTWSTSVDRRPNRTQRHKLRNGAFREIEFGAMRSGGLREMTGLSRLLNLGTTDRNCSINF